MTDQVEVRLGVSGQDTQQDGAVTGHLDHLGNGRVGVLVADDEKRMLTKWDARGRVFDPGVGETTRVGTLEVDPKSGRAGAGRTRPDLRFSVGLGRFELPTS